MRRPERTIPRAILISVCLFGVLYCDEPRRAAFMGDAAAHGPRRVRVQLVADIAAVGVRRTGPVTPSPRSSSGRRLPQCFSLQLGYSRVPYAAARDGNYFRFLDAVHPKHGIPHRSLVALGLFGAFFCFFTLAQVITMLVITRILLQFFLQQFGVIYLRVRQPNSPRPFRMPLYPLPPLVAMAGFGFLLVYRAHAFMELGVAAGIAISGTLIYLIRAVRLREWPFAQAKEQA